MPKDTRFQKLENYRNSHHEIVAALRKFPKEMWDYKPETSQWCIAEIIVHLADSEVNGYVRCRKIIAEPGQPITTYDQALWATGLDYMNQDTQQTLELFRLLRETTYRILKSLPDEVWQNTLLHPERGPLTLDGWLDIYEAHPRKHISQMHKVFEKWNLSSRR